MHHFPASKSSDRQKFGVGASVQRVAPAHAITEDAEWARIQKRCRRQKVFPPPNQAAFTMDPPGETGRRVKERSRHAITESLVAAAGVSASRLLRGKGQIVSGSLSGYSDREGPAIGLATSPVGSRSAGASTETLPGAKASWPQSSGPFCHGLAVPRLRSACVFLTRSGDRSDHRCRALTGDAPVRGRWAGTIPLTVIRRMLARNFRGPAGKGRRLLSAAICRRLRRKRRAARVLFWVAIFPWRTRPRSAIWLPTDRRRRACGIWKTWPVIWPRWRTVKRLRGPARGIKA